MKKIILLFVSYICINFLTAKETNKRGRYKSDESFLIDQKELEEDQNITISSFETKIQLKAEAFYEELLEDQTIATQLKTLITDLMYYQDILIKTNYSYNHLLIYDQIISFLKKIDHLSISELSLRNLSINDAPSLFSSENRSQITNKEFIKICEKILKNKEDLKKINLSEKNIKYPEILNKSAQDRFQLIIEIPENQEFQIENENRKKLQILREKEKQNNLLQSEIDEYKLLKNKEANKQIRIKNNNKYISQESSLLSKAEKRLISKMQTTECKEAKPTKLEESTYFFILPNTNLRQEILTFNQYKR